MVPFVGGSFDSLVFSPEMVVYADDLIGQSRSFSAGFSLDDEAVGLSDIADIGPGGDFLVSNLTAKHFRESRFSSTIWPCLSLEKWQAKGEPAPDTILRQKTCELLRNPLPPDDSKNLLARGEGYLASQGNGA